MEFFQGRKCVVDLFVLNLDELLRNTFHFTEYTLYYNFCKINSSIIISTRKYACSLL